MARGRALEARARSARPGARAYAIDPRLRADIAASTGQLETYRAGPEKGAQILVEAADAIEAIDPERATRLLTYAVNVAVFALDIDEAVALAARAVRVRRARRAASTSSPARSRASKAVCSPRDPSVPEQLAPLAQLAEALIESDLADAEHVFSLVLLADFTLENWDRAEWLLDIMVRRAHATGRLFLLAVALVIRTELDWRRGRWSEAYAHRDHRGVGDAARAARRRFLAPRVAGARRSRPRPRRRRRCARAAALAAATETGSYAAIVWAEAALGFHELGCGHPQAAIEHLERVAAIVERGGVHEPGILWWAPDLIEAYWRVGDIGAARRRLEVFRAQADATGRAWAQRHRRRVPPGSSRRRPTRPKPRSRPRSSRTPRLEAPFERARTLLRLGERRREFGRPDADEPLQEALATFERLGAAPWVAQARKLLGDDTVAPERVELTRQERQVAAIVARGATNREAADELFLSPRTIDFHLRNIYKKLQVRSRTELAFHLAAQDTSI